MGGHRADEWPARSMTLQQESSPRTIPSVHTYCILCHYGTVEDTVSLLSGTGCPAKMAGEPDGLGGKNSEASESEECNSSSECRINIHCSFCPNN